MCWLILIATDTGVTSSSSSYLCLAVNFWFELYSISIILGPVHISYICNEGRSALGCYPCGFSMSSPIPIRSKFYLFRFRVGPFSFLKGKLLLFWESENRVREDKPRIQSCRTKRMTMTAQRTFISSLSQGPCHVCWLLESASSDVSMQLLSLRSIVHIWLTTSVLDSDFVQQQQQWRV